MSHLCLQNHASSLDITLKIVSSPKLSQKTSSRVVITFEMDSSLEITLKTHSSPKITYETGSSHDVWKPCEFVFFFLFRLLFAQETGIFFLFFQNSINTKNNKG